MKIEMGKYSITSDPLCIILNEKKAIKSGENKGKEYFSPIGYYSTVEDCMEALLQFKIRESDATSWKELMDMIKETSKFIREEFRKARVKK